MSRVLTTALMFVCLSAAGGCRQDEAYEKPLTPVRVDQVVGAGGTGGLRFSAVLLPARRIDLAFKVPGYVGDIAQARDGAGPMRWLQEGDRVRRSQILAQVRPTDFVAKVNQAKSQQAEAEAALEQARQANERAAVLFERQSITRPEYEAARAAYDTVMAKRAGAIALVAEAENALADAALRSPIDGIVIRRLIEVGSLVGSGTPGFILADISSVKARFGAPDTLVRRFTINQPQAVTTEAFANERFEGRITSTSPAADPGSLAFDVEVTIPNRDGRLKPGMVVSLELEDVATGSRLTVPLSAIIRSKSRPDGYAVFVVEEEDPHPVARLRDVMLGDMIGNAISVTDGLQAGDRVVVSGATIVTDGEPVEILR